MEKYNALKRISREDGISTLVTEIKDNLLRREGAKYLKKVVGKRMHLKLLMYDQLEYWPNIKNPETFNENIAHRKLYTDEEAFAYIEDKWQVREYVINKIGDEILPEVYYVTESPSSIPFEDLPSEYVIKPTHMSGPVIIVDEDEEPDQEGMITSCIEWLDTTYGDIKEEYWYERITPRILIEERLDVEGKDVPPDYKFFVFDGQVKYVQVDHDRFENHQKRLYDRDWNPQEFEFNYPVGPVTERPANYERMVTIAEQLGKEFPFIRVDLYEVEDRIVFGELTVAPASGLGKFVPRRYDHEFGSLW